jgi:hypothetical protein
MHTAIGPEIAQMVSLTVDASLQRAMSPENQLRMASTVAVIVEQSVTTLAASLNSQLRPTLQAMLREDVGPALRDGLRDPQTQLAIAAAMRTLTKEAVLGMQDAFSEIDARPKVGGQPPTLLARLQGLAVEGTNLFRTVAIALGIAVLLLVVWLWKTRSRVSVATREGARRESALVSLAQALKSTQDKPWAGELQTVIENALRDDEKAEYLHELWRKNHTMRLGTVPPPAQPTVPSK